MEIALGITSAFLVISFLCYLLTEFEVRHLKGMLKESRDRELKYLEERNKAFERAQELREDYRAIVRRLENEKNWYANALGSAMSKEG